jgi:light-regulated signal transduction histidine kinase (bacteriophytochrome)
LRHIARRVDNRDSFEAAVHQECPGLILSDYALPAFDARTALGIAREICPDVPFIVLSDAVGEEIAVEMLKRGATDYVLKQHIERLAPAVRRALIEAAERKERRRAEEELARKAHELQMLNADLEQFAYAASHDLQEPLRTISIFARLLSKRYQGKLDEQADEYLEYIESAARHMSALLEDLLLYAQVPAQERMQASVDMNGIVQQVVFLFRSQIEQTGALVLHDPLPVVRGNEKQLLLVMQNLVSNSLKYRSEQPPEIRITCEANEEYRFCVADNGVGFDQAYADQIFGLFKRLRKGDAPGTGLGLAICKRIIELHDGRIWAESVPDRGARFYFTLPVPGKSSPNVCLQSTAQTLPPKASRPG